MNRQLHYALIEISRDLTTQVYQSRKHNYLRYLFPSCKIMNSMTLFFQVDSLGNYDGFKFISKLMKHKLFIGSILDDLLDSESPNAVPAAAVGFAEIIALHNYLGGTARMVPASAPVAATVAALDVPAAAAPALAAC